MDILVLKAQELEARGIIDDKTTKEFIFQGKLLKKGQLFSKRFRQVAIDTCQQKLDAGRFCVVIEGEVEFAVWEEKIVTPVSHISKSNFLQPPPPHSTVKLAALEPEFLKLCQKELVEFVGPIAEYILDETIKQYPSLTPKQLIEVLAKEISNPEQAKKFKQRLQ
ncbi:hypothetical protein [Calothrix rhizosoleniae]|uniref:hypothetical protein n=1 Tax=Calothrix rhizosoleniae TaxID=888997 RepID=UPI000B49DBD9|nr:hypothetical protein [Calothrix rhizosoleniae]